MRAVATRRPAIARAARGPPRRRAPHAARAALADDAPTLYSWVATAAALATAAPLALAPRDTVVAAAEGRTADRPAHVALSIVSFLPFVNWMVREWEWRGVVGAFRRRRRRRGRPGRVGEAGTRVGRRAHARPPPTFSQAFASLLALDLAQGAPLACRARAGAAAALYAAPVAAAAATGDARAAVAATVVCAAHFQAERVLRSFESGTSGGGGGVDEAANASTPPLPWPTETAAAALELAAWDARLALATARKAARAELAARAGVVARARDTKADLVAALTAAGGLEEEGATASPASAPWLAGELAARGAAAVGAAKRVKRKRRPAGGKARATTDD